jgi:hypothetical protein
MQERTSDSCAKESASKARVLKSVLIDSDILIEVSRGKDKATL